MAHTYNEAARVQKIAESGLVWEEKISNGTGVIEVPKYSAVRVRAVAGPIEVYIGDVLAATMDQGEILIFNSGIGDISDVKRTVSVEIADAGEGSTAYVQVGRTVEQKREDKIAN